MKPTAKNKRNPEKRGGIRELLTEKKKKENPDHKRLPERKMSVGGYFDHSDEELSDLETDIGVITNIFKFLDTGEMQIDTPLSMLEFNVKKAVKKLVNGVKNF